MFLSSLEYSRVAQAKLPTTLLQLIVKFWSIVKRDDSIVQGTMKLTFSFMSGSLESLIV